MNGGQVGSLTGKDFKIIINGGIIRYICYDGRTAVINDAKIDYIDTLNYIYYICNNSSIKNISGVDTDSVSFNLSSCMVESISIAGYYVDTFSFFNTTIGYFGIYPSQEIILYENSKIYKLIIDEYYYEWVESSGDTFENHGDQTVITIKSGCIDIINKKCDNAILNDFKWKDNEFYLSMENQMNFANLYIARELLTYPQTIKTKTGYIELQNAEEVAEFYFAGVNHIKACLEKCWKEKQHFEK